MLVIHVRCACLLFLLHGNEFVSIVWKNQKEEQCKVLTLPWSVEVSLILRAMHAFPSMSQVTLSTTWRKCGSYFKPENMMN